MFNIPDLSRIFIIDAECSELILCLFIDFTYFNTGEKGVMDGVCMCAEVGQRCVHIHTRNLSRMENANLLKDPQCCNCLQELFSFWSLSLKG